MFGTIDTLKFFAPYVGLIYLIYAAVDGYCKWRAIKNGMDFSQEIKQELKDSIGDIIVTTENRLRFVKRSVSSVMEYFWMAVVIIILLNIGCIIEGNFVFSAMLGMFSFAVLCSAFFILKDAIKVAPWNKIYW